MSNSEHKVTLKEVENPNLMGDKDPEEEDVAEAIKEKQDKLIDTKHQLHQIKKAAKDA